MRTTPKRAISNMAHQTNHVITIIYRDDRYAKELRMEGGPYFWAMRQGHGRLDEIITSALASMEDIGKESPEAEILSIYVDANIGDIIDAVNRLNLIAKDN